MKLIVKIKLNALQEIETTFEGSDLGDVILRAQPLLDYDGKCGLCGKTNIQLRTRIAGDAGQYKYTEFICRDCGARRQMGKHKADNSYFLKSTWEKKYEKPAEAEGTGSAEEMPEA